MKRRHPHCLNEKRAIHLHFRIGIPFRMRESSVTTPDRRQAPRTKLVEIAYIGMGPDNGGLVLDVSDGGLSFHAVAPVRQAETIHFLLSQRGHSRIEGAGEVVWTNDMRTVCGLRFTSLSAGAREYLNNWTNQSKMAVAARKKAVSPAPSVTRTTVKPPAYLASQSASEAQSVAAIPPARDVYLSEPTAGSLWREPVFFWVMFGILCTVLAVTAFIYGVRVGRSESSSVEQPAAVPSSQASPQVPEPATVPGSSGATDSAPVSAVAPPVPSNSTAVQRDVSSVPNEETSHLRGAFVNASKTDGIPAGSLQHSDDGGLDAKAPDQHAEMALEAGKSELAAALASLRGTNGVRDSSKAARLLWAAVKNNNSTAEVVLADLYLRGDGVAKSCEQARVLLEAASKSGSVQGQEKLGELDTNGCP